MTDDLLGIGQAASALSKPLEDFLNKLLGPAAEEAGQLLSDRIRYMRFKNSLHILEQAKREMDLRGIIPDTIPLKTLVPILEGASLEDEDENLQAKWANLLTSAASGDATHPSYPKILSELTSTEARILDHVYKTHQIIEPLKAEFKAMREQKLDWEKQRAKRKEIQEAATKFKLEKIRDDLELETEHFSASINILLRLQLCGYPEEVSEIKVITEASLNQYTRKIPARYNRDNKENTELDKSTFFEEDEYEIDTENEYVFSREKLEHLVNLTTLGKKFMFACESHA
ncbi:MAG: Abi-alpha family protein [Cyanobacteria bacterium P01_C01_bin.121]